MYKLYQRVDVVYKNTRTPGEVSALEPGGYFYVKGLDGSLLGYFRPDGYQLGFMSVHVESLKEQISAAGWAPAPEELSDAKFRAGPDHQYGEGIGESCQCCDEHDHRPDLVTHKALDKALDKALEAIDSDGKPKKTPLLIQIWETIVDYFESDELAARSDNIYRDLLEQVLDDATGEDGNKRVWPIRSTLYRRIARSIGYEYNSERANKR